MTSRCRAIRAAVSIFALLSMLTPFQSISAQQGDAARHDDPTSRFTVPVPTNWTVDERAGFAVLRDPDGDLAVTLIVVPGTSAEDAAEAANLFTEGIGYRLLELMYGLPSSFDTEIEFFLEESEKAVEAMRAQIDDVPEGVLELALGSYRSDILGDVELSREGAALILDAGEFSAELKYVPGASGDGDFTFVAAEPPLTGTPFVLRIGAGDSWELELDIGTDQYVFRATGSATPISVPGDATPVAA